jgi:hypothetical protein
MRLTIWKRPHKYLFARHDHQNDVLATLTRFATRLVVVVVVVDWNNSISWSAKSKKDIGQ